MKVWVWGGVCKYEYEWSMKVWVGPLVPNHDWFIQVSDNHSLIMPIHSFFKCIRLSFWFIYKYLLQSSALLRYRITCSIFSIMCVLHAVLGTHNHVFSDHRDMSCYMSAIFNFTSFKANYSTLIIIILFLFHNGELNMNWLFVATKCIIIWCHNTVIRPGLPANMFADLLSTTHTHPRLLVSNRLSR